MAVNKAQSDIFMPLRGWITEGNEGNWPQDIALDIENMQVSIAGVTSRRFGIDVSVNDQLLYLDGDHKKGAVSFGRWLSAFGQGQNAIVIQFGNNLYVFREMQPTIISLVTVFPLNAYAVNALVFDQLAATPCSFANIQDVLVVVNKYMEPFYLHWVIDPDDPDVPKMDIQQVGVAQRVFESMSKLPPGTRSSFLTHELEFDLRSAGWPFLAQCATNQEGEHIVMQDPVDKYFFVNDRYPALSEIFYTMQITQSENANALGSFSAWDNQYSVVDNGTGPSGKFLTMVWDLNTLEILRAAAAAYEGNSEPATWLFLIALNTVFFGGDTSLLVEGPGIRRTTDIRPVAVASLNGHIIYAMQDYNKRWVIGFSQTVQALNDIGKCYQQADPTAEEINDLVATDGGIIPIPNMGEPVELVELTNSVLIVAENGVWAISGGEDGSPFGATSYSINKISTYGTLNKQSIVAMNGSVYFWTNDAIVLLSPVDGGGFQVTRISDDTIRSWVLERTGIAGGVQGVGDSYNNRVIWTIPDDVSKTVTQCAASTVLILDLNLRGFFRHRVDATLGAYLVCPVVFPPRNVVAANGTVIDTAVSTVVTDTGDTVVFGSEVTIEPTSKDYNYLCFGTYGGSPVVFFATYNNRSFKDWTQFTGAAGVEVPAYVEFPYRYAQTRAAGIQVPYVHSFWKLFRSSYPESWPVEPCNIYTQANMTMKCTGLEVNTLYLGHSLTDVPFGG
jgi:hypothetical protein